MTFLFFVVVVVLVVVFLFFFLPWESSTTLIWRILSWTEAGSVWPWLLVGSMLDASDWAEIDGQKTGGETEKERRGWISVGRGWYIRITEGTNEKKSTQHATQERWRKIWWRRRKSRIFLRGKFPHFSPCSSFIYSIDKKREKRVVNASACNSTSHYGR